MITIYDVAKEAGVSPATVSRVLNKNSSVKAETKKRVEEACYRLKYVPNSNASSLKRKTTKTLSLVIPDIQNPFFVSVLKGFEDKASEHGYTTIFCNTDETYEKEENYVRMLLEKRIDGVALSTVSKTSALIKEIIDRCIPFILLDRKIEEIDVDIVCGDSYQGAIQLVNHLIEEGHREIAMITAPLHLSTSLERVEGYKEALMRAGIPLRPELLKIDTKSEGFSRRRAYEMTIELMQGEVEFTAIFVANNFMALGAYEALRREEVEVPGQVALVCFDDLSLDYEIHPFFTVMRQPAYTMGSISSEMLINRIEGDYEKNRQRVVLKPELVVRSSSKRSL